MTPRVIPAALAAAAGVSAWLSMGAVAVTDTASRARVGILPSLWVLALIVAVFAGAAIASRVTVRRALPLSLTLLLWLPWLPGRVPAAFLIWSGPMAWLVWGAVALGLAAPGLRAVAGIPALSDPRRAPWVAGLVAAACYLAGAVTIIDRIPAGDEPHYLVITQSLIRDQDLRIENNHADGDYAPYFSGELKPDYLRRGQDGAIYSIHAPGVSAVVLPGFVLAGYPGALLTMIAVAALAMAGVWLLAWQVTRDAASAWVAFGSVALTTPMFFHGFAIYPDGAGAACTAAGLWLLVRLDRQQPAGVRSIVAVSAALALLPWLHTRFAIVAGILGGAIALRPFTAVHAGETRAHRVRHVVRFLAIPAVGAAAWFGYFWLIWGTPNPAAPYGHYTQSSIAQMSPGLTGLLFDQQFGLLASAPVYLVALAGFLPLARRRPRLAIELALLLLVYTAAVASYRMWWGGYSAPARFLVVVLPVAAVPIAMLWHAIRTPASRAIVLALLALSLALVLPRVLVQNGVLLYNGRDGHDLMLDWANRSVDLTRAFASAHRDAVPAALADAALWLAAGVLCLGACRWLARRRGDPWTWASAGLASTLMLAATLVWARSGSTALTPNTSAPDLLHHWQGRWHVVGWQSRPWRLLAGTDAAERLQFGSGERGVPDPGVSPLFTVPLLPAGDYDISVGGAARPSGEVVVHVGRTDQVLERMRLDAAAAGEARLMLHLPVRVHSVTIRGDAEARASVSDMRLRPRALGDGRAPDVTDLALRATRYGRTRVFFLDGNAFMEPPGFWTRGADRTVVIMDTDDGAPPVVTVRAGPIATTARLSVGEWTEDVALEAGETRVIVLPPPGAADAWLLGIETGPGFRPAQHDERTEDMRHLGVWVEVG